MATEVLTCIFCGREFSIGTERDFCDEDCEMAYAEDDEDEDSDGLNFDEAVSILTDSADDPCFDGEELAEDSCYEYREGWEGIDDKLDREEREKNV